MIPMGLLNTGIKSALQIKVFGELHHDYIGYDTIFKEVISSNLVQENTNSLPMSNFGETFRTRFPFLKTTLFQLPPMDQI